MTKFLSILEEGLSKNNLSLSDGQTQQLVTYLELMQTWNKVFNLTNITTPHDMVYLHIIDSLLINPFLHGKRFLDVGSGAGLPGIPLAILNPDLEWTLLDKNNKKTRFMRQAAAELQLLNVKIIHSRTEEFHPEQGFDSILSRAFASLTTFVDTTKHLLAEQGIFLAMKGKFPHDELSELPAARYNMRVEEIVLKGMDVERHIVCIRPTN